TALKRLEQLHSEIAFFFRAKVHAPCAEVDQARSRFQQELQSFHGDIHTVRNRAEDKLKGHRQQFEEKLQPLFAASVQGVDRSIEGWKGVHWGTLRAIVQRDGAFKSPSTGRSFDFNEDLAEPLLARLPVSWEQYFTNDLGRVTDDLVVQL